MTNEIKSNLYPCAHCEQTGTCRNGLEGATCEACIKKNEVKGKGLTGLSCGICGGIGQAEPMTERMNKRITPLLSMLIVLPLLLLIFIAMLTSNEHFNQILAFSSAIIGSVIGFYFSGSRQSR